MGQYISYGIVIGIEVYAKKNENRDMNDLETIKKHLSNYFCLEHYDLDLEKYENAFCFNIKKEMLEENIHDYIRDFSKLIKPDLKYIFDKEIDYNSKKFNQENYPLRLNWIEDYDGKKLKIVGKDGELYKASLFGDPYWLYRDCNLLGYKGKYRIWLEIRTIWHDQSKISMEDETVLLYCLNKMKKEYFKHPLEQSTVFFIDG